MIENKQDELDRAYTMLLSLRENIDSMTTNSIQEKYVHRFHDVLDRLGGIDIDVTEYRVLDSEIAPVRTSIPVFSFGTESTGKVSYSKEKYVDKSFILIKLDAILGYLDSLTSDKPEKPRKIGYPTPDNK